MGSLTISQNCQFSDTDCLQKVLANALANFGSKIAHRTRPLPNYPLQQIDWLVVTYCMMRLFCPQVGSAA